jgi:outer membrane receptor protein involved in Fe transport
LDQFSQGRPKLSKLYNEDSPWPGLAGFLQRNGTPAALAGKGAFVSPVTGINDLNFYSSAVSQNLRQLALFGEATYSFTDQLDLTVGGRYFDIRQNFLFVANPLSIFVTADAAFRKSALKEDGFNPKATLSFKPSGDLLVFGTVAKGFRPGGFNQPVSSNPQCLAEFGAIGFNPNDVPGFQSDSLWSYEAGVKGSLADRRIQFSGAAYQIDWKDIQLRNQLSCGFTIFDTASKARIRGLEGTINARVADGLTLGLNTAFTDAKLLSAKVTTGGIAGDRLLGIPRFTLSGSVDYVMPVSPSTDAFVRVDANYVSSYDSYFSTELYGGAPKNRKLGGYAITNARVGLTSNQDVWDAQVFVNNVFNKLGDAGAQVGIFGDVAFRTRPREAGVKVSRKF